LIQKGKTKRFKGRPGVRSDLRKAIVTLAPGSRSIFTTVLRISARKNGTELNGTEAIQSGHGKPPRTVLIDRSEALEGKPVKG